jgi:hypothetical protein
MSEINPATANTRVAIECLMLWMEQDRLGAAQHIAKLQDDPDGPGADAIIVGFLSLSHLLVLMLAKERGAQREDLVDMARGILSSLSRDLPE